MYENINLTIPTDSITHNLIYGMRLILKYQEDAKVTIHQHDTVYFGNSSKDISSKDREFLVKWGWYEENGYWAINV